MVLPQVQRGAAVPPPSQPKEFKREKSGFNEQRGSRDEDSRGGSSRSESRRGFSEHGSSSSRNKRYDDSDDSSDDSQSRSSSSNRKSNRSEGRDRPRRNDSDDSRESRDSSSRNNDYGSSSSSRSRFAPAAAKIAEASSSTPASTGNKRRFEDDNASSEYGSARKGFGFSYNSSSDARATSKEIDDGNPFDDDFNERPSFGSGGNVAAAAATKAVPFVSAGTQLPKPVSFMSSGTTQDFSVAPPPLPNAGFPPPLLPPMPAFVKSEPASSEYGRLGFKTELFSNEYGGLGSSKPQTPQQDDPKVKKRRSRWGDAGDSQGQGQGQLVPPPGVASMPQLGVGGVQIPPPGVVAAPQLGASPALPQIPGA